MSEKTLQLVSFEQAKKLKKLGFDWECYLVYRIADNEFGKKSNEPVGYQGAVIDDYAHAPSVALALKWFRDEKGKATTIRYYDKFYYRNQDDSQNPSKYSTYEEAESALLDRLIELELKKNKKPSTILV